MKNVQCMQSTQIFLRRTSINYEGKASICNYICICNSKNKRKNINKSTIKNHTIADNYLEYDLS